MPSASNKYFDGPATVTEHPRIRAWSSYKNMASVRRVELEIHRQRDGLTFLPTRMFVTFYGGADDVVRLDEAGWELELDNWLLKQRIKSTDADAEKLRFSLRLKSAFRPIAVHFGDGYFNSVLVQLLRRSPFAEHADLAAVLDEIHEYAANGDSRQDCEELIDREIGIAAHDLMELYADRERAEDILSGAIAQYLDERFHITEGRMIGFR